MINNPPVLPLQIDSSARNDKATFYDHLAKSLRALLQGEKNWIVNLSNTASLLFNSYHQTSRREINWTGFYMLPHLFPHAPQSKPLLSKPDPFASNKLLLGPFQGKPACQHIILPPLVDETPVSKSTKSPVSVCARSFIDRAPQLVQDVSKFPGHIACDSDTKSELVLPILIKRQGVNCCVGVLDLDCTIVNGFDEEDVKGLQNVLEVLVKCTEWW
ncbi:hypothetical protein O181_057874 [Austropuccinia psidii MF-1]|uniref:GAF domain-containing protein n=1 Tax=Austropuccinia psidii MF-1 TaxID=1389203 RepID=A0A9Q3EB93_9BASI|nr:hypothetical protein [Austropuccinia psidii MF-1]